MDIDMNDNYMDGYYNGESDGWHSGCESAENDYVFRIAKYLNQKRGLKTEEEIAKAMEEDFEIDGNLAGKGASIYMAWLEKYHPEKCDEKSVDEK